MLIQKVSLQNEQNKSNKSFTGKCLSGGLDIYQNRRIELIAQPLQEMVKDASCDLLIVQYKRKGIIKIVAQKLDDYKNNCGKRIEKILHTKKIHDNNTYLEYAKQVVEKYEQPSWYKKLYSSIKNNFNKNINH